jgi:hypothetical protein
MIVQNVSEKGYTDLTFTVRKEDMTRAKKLADPKYNAGESPERPFLRKPQFAFKWDWAPRLVTCGIWRGVELKLYQHAAIRDVMLTPAFDGDAATLEAKVEVEAFEPGIDARLALG